MARERNSEHLRYRYGICLNDNCEKCKSKEVQQIAARKDFVCQNPECGKPLRECPPPKKGPNKMMIGAIAALVIILAALGLFFGLSDGGSTESTPAVTDRVAVKEQIPTPAPQSRPKAAAKTNGKLSLSYGSYSGDIKKGYPDGMGRLTYNSSRVINKFDPKKRTANAGDYVIGEFVNGFFVQGKHYDSSGNVVETLMIGTPPSDSYESK